MSAPFSPIALRRRPALERRALAMLRGDEQHFHADEDARASEPSRQAAKSQALFFAELRRVAARHGITVLPPGSRLVGEGEMLLLTWLSVSPATAAPSRPIRC